MNQSDLEKQLPLFDTKALHRADPERLELIRGFMKPCRLCSLRASATQVLPGEGNATSPVVAVVIGAPSYIDDQSNKLYYGKTGNLFESMLSVISMKREDVFLCSTVACAPPRYKDPSVQHIESCYSWLTGQLRCVQPKLIIAMGGVAFQTFSSSKDFVPLAEARGKWHYWQGIPVRATFPTTLLEVKPEAKFEAMKDLQAVAKFIQENE